MRKEERQGRSGEGTIPPLAFCSCQDAFSCRARPLPGVVRTLKGHFALQVSFARPEKASVSLDSLQGN